MYYEVYNTVGLFMYKYSNQLLLPIVFNNLVSKLVDIRDDVFPATNFKGNR